jgi:hypothetical protein
MSSQRRYACVASAEWCNVASYIRVCLVVAAFAYSVMLANTLDLATQTANRISVSERRMTRTEALIHGHAMLPGAWQCAASALCALGR